MNWYLVKAEHMREPSAEIVQNLGETMGRELTLIKALPNGGLELHLTKFTQQWTPRRAIRL